MSKLSEECDDYRAVVQALVNIWGDSLGSVGDLEEIYDAACLTLDSWNEDSPNYKGER